MFKTKSVIFGLCLLISAGCSQGLPGLGGETRESGEIEIENSRAEFHIVDGTLQLIIWKYIDYWNVEKLESGPEGDKIKLKDGRTLEWEIDSDTITVNGQQYSLNDGRILLLSFADAEVQVQQLNLDLSKMGSSSEEIRKSLIKLAEENQVVREFLDSIETGHQEQVETE